MKNIKREESIVSSTTPDFVGNRLVNLFLLTITVLLHRVCIE